MKSVLQKSKQVKTRVYLKIKRVVLENGKVCLNGIQTLNAWDAVLHLFCEQSCFGARLCARPKGWMIHAKPRGYTMHTRSNG